MKTWSILSLVIGCLVLGSCKDITEPNLSKQVITLVAPADNDSTSQSTITFWWNKVDEQNTYTYRLQIVKPNFTSPQLMVLDSTTTSNKYTVVLDPGKYQWRVRVENNSSSSPYTTRSITIDSSLNLASKKVTPLYPLNSTPVISSTSVGIKWYPLTNADHYYLYLYQVDNLGNSSPLTSIPNIATTTYTYNFSSYGVYQWQVIGFNSTSNSLISDAQTFTLSIPAPISLTNADSNTVGQPLILNWAWPTGSPAIGDSLIIYKDFQTTSSEAIVTYLTTKTYSAFSSNPLTPSGHTYYWKVKSIDASGNSSAWVQGTKFKMK